MRLFQPLLAAGVLAFAAPALAQQPPELGVMDRARPDYDAKGIAVGSFRLKPALDIGANIDDNIDRVSTAPQSDIYFSIAPSFSLKSDWGRHMIELTGSATRYQYASLIKENRTDWNVGFDGRYDVWHDIAVNGATSYGLYHEPRYSANDPGNAATATSFSLLHGELSVDKLSDPFGVSLGGTFNRFNYRNTPLIGGGVQNNDARDEDSWSGFAKAAYEITTGFAVFLRGSYDARQFDITSARDSHGYRAAVGSDLFLSHLVRGEVFVGYVNMQFKAPLPSIQTIDYGAALHWYVTKLMTFHLTASRQFNDTTIAGASVSDDKVFGASLDYELFRNLILQGHVDYTDSRFVGGARTDHILQAGLNAQYLINRYLAATASYVWQRRQSNVAGAGFNDNTVSAGLHFQL
jgi:hypothetical protein